MSAHVVTAPCVVARLEDGTRRYFYEGAPLPTSDLAKGELTRLREGGFIAKAEDVEDAAQQSTPTGPPARNASREAWAEYALTLGATEQDLAGQNRDYIRDLVDLHTAAQPQS